MYLYKSAIALARTNAAQWQDISFETYSWAEIFRLFSHAYICAYSSADEADIYIDINSYRNSLSDQELSVTVKQWLTNKNNLPLIYTKEKPNTTVKYVKYNDAFKAGYRVNVGLMGVDAVESYPYSDRVDLALSRPDHDTDLRLLDTHCLVSLNGLIFDTQSSRKTCFLPQAVKAIKDRKNVSLGILSFYDVAKLTKVKITDSMVSSQTTESKLKEKIYLTVKDSLDGSSFFLALGGFLVLCDDQALTQVSSNTVSLDINKIPFVERIVEAIRITDMSHLGLTASAGYNTINLEQLYSDECLLKLLKGYNSFFVIVPGVKLQTKKTALRTSNIPGSLVAWQEPTSLMIGAYGKIVNYWKIHEAGQWAVSIPDAYRRNYSFSTRPINEQTNIVTDILPQGVNSPTSVELLDIYSLPI